MQPTFKAPSADAGIDPKKLIRDTRTTWQQIKDSSKTPVMLGGIIAGLGFSMLFAPEYSFLAFPFSFLLYWSRLRVAKKECLPFRMPYTSGLIDYNDPKPGRTGFQKASGAFYLGNIFGLTNSELWLGVRDMLTHMLIFGTTGSGKAQPLDAPILTPHGWTTMGDINIGDIVISRSGRFSRVIGRYPQGLKSIYRITLKDGSSVECCLEHLWRIKYQGDERTISCKDISDLLNTAVTPIRLPRLSSCNFEYWTPIQSIDYSRQAEAQCIYIEDPSHLYVTSDRILTHNTETLVSMSFNALAMGSGLFYVDPKGSPKLIAQLFVMSRIVGRECEFRCVNYLVAEKASSGQKMPLRTTNTNNPFSYGNAESLSNMLNSLIAKSEGGNAIFSTNAQNLMKSTMYALVEMRDNGEIQLSAKTIRDYLTLTKVMALAERTDFTQNTRDAIRAFLTSVGWQEGKDEKSQPKSLPEQFGYARSYFGAPLNNLTDTYGHIYGTPFGEVDMRDIVLNRRILAIIIPSLAMAPEEVKALGVISLSAIRIAISVGLGSGKEGSFADALEALPTDAPSPFLSITDEYAAIPTPGYVEVLTQGRGLYISAIVASQDFAGITKADKEGAQQLLENTKVKLFMKGTAAGETFDVAKGLAGEVTIIETGGYSVKTDSSSMLMDYRDTLTTNTKERTKIHLADLQEQIEGEFHGFFGSTMVRGMTFFANPPLKSNNQFQYAHLVKIYPPKISEIKAKFGETSKLLDFMMKEFVKLQSETVQDGQSAIENREQLMMSRYENEWHADQAGCPKFITNLLSGLRVTDVKASKMDLAIAAFMVCHGETEESPDLEDFLNQEPSAELFGQSNLNNLSEISDLDALSNVDDFDNENSNLKQKNDNYFPQKSVASQHEVFDFMDNDPFINPSINNRVQSESKLEHNQKVERTIKVDQGPKVDQDPKVNQGPKLDQGLKVEQDLFDFPDTDSTLPSNNLIPEEKSINDLIKLRQLARERDTIIKPKNMIEDFAKIDAELIKTKAILNVKSNDATSESDGLSSANVNAVTTSLPSLRENDLNNHQKTDITHSIDRAKILVDSAQTLNDAIIQKYPRQPTPQGNKREHDYVSKRLENLIQLAKNKQK